MKNCLFSSSYFLMFIVIFFSLISCTSKENFNDKEVAKPNIVFLFSDDQSVPDLGAYGNPVINTPHLDRMAEEGMLFTRAYVTTPQCSPSRASILLGRSPHAVGASRLHQDAQKNFPSIVQILRNEGYYTGAYRKVHQGHIQSQFDFYSGSKDEEKLSLFFDTRPTDKPFFLWFGSNDPHRPYNSEDYDYLHDPEKVVVPDGFPDTKAVREDIANYYNEITRFDKESGYIMKLLEEHGLAGNTIIVCSSDNGMPFPRAKATMYEAGIKVPLIIKWPGKIKGGSVTKELVSLLDLTPTWLEAAGIPVPEAMEGVSLMPLLKGSSSDHREFVFVERNWHDNWDPMRAIVGKKYKLIQNYRPNSPTLHTLGRLVSPTWKEFEKLRVMSELSEKQQWFSASSKPRVEFYDLENDPGEWNNLVKSPKYDSLINQYQQILAEWMNETHDFLPPPVNAFSGRFDDEYDVLNAEEK